MSPDPISGEILPDPEALLALIRTPMPFGKHAGTPLVDLPEPYVVWFAQQGFPPGKLGRQLQAVYDIKVNGLEPLLAPLRVNATSAAPP